MGLKETYNKIAKEWHKDHQEDDWWHAGTDKFISFLNKGSLVLDVGCGSGTKSKFLIKKGLKVVGIDFSEEMIKIAKEKVSFGQFITMDLNDIEKLPNSFDGIFMQAVLLHVPKKEISEKFEIIAKKIKKNGYIYCRQRKEKRWTGRRGKEVKISRLFL